MSDLRFCWDPKKAELNLQKHGVSFEEAEDVFLDPLAAIFDDVAHSVEEEREIIVGHSRAGQILLVSFTERQEGIRIISVRKATLQERRDYEEGRGH